jgi:tetrahydromethanopterin S-methyltransferase subunit D
MGTGTVTFAAGAGVTLNSSAGLIETANQYALAAVFKTGTNEWLLTGDIG